MSCLELAQEIQSPSVRIEPGEARRSRRGLWPLALWLLLWASLNTGPDHLWSPRDLLQAFNGVRSLLPVLVMMGALVWWLREEPALWSPASPLGLLTISAIAGVAASLIMSPAPLLSGYWALSYAAVLAVLRLKPFTAASAGALRRLIRMNWVIVIGLAVTISLFSFSIMTIRHFSTIRTVYGAMPVIAGMPTVLPTGLARYWAITGILTLPYAFRARAMRHRIAWVALLGVAAGFMIGCESRAAIVAFVMGAGLVCVLYRRTRLITAIALGAAVLCCVFPTQLVTAIAGFLHLGYFGGVLSGRHVIWESAVRLWTLSPLLGFGFQADRLLLQGPWTTHTSFAFLQMMLQGGLVSVLAFTGAWLMTWRLVHQHSRQFSSYDAVTQTMWAQVAGVLMFLCVRSLFESSGAFFGVDWLLLAPLMAYVQQAAHSVIVDGSQTVGMSEPMPTMTILGVRVHPIEMRQTLSLIEGWIRGRQYGRHVVVTGMHGVMEARRDPAFKAIVNRADLFVPDGYSLVWLARRRGFHLSARVCGTELLHGFCRVAAQRGYRVFFYGDTESVLGALQHRLRNEFPTLQIVGSYSPPFRPLTGAEDAQVVARINAAKPDIVWVGLGLPKQEWWIAAHRDRLEVPVLVGVGAAFKFVSGTVKRAPRWIGEHGLEWLWRFVQEPRKLWRRALVDVPQFIWLVVLELAGWRTRSVVGGPSASHDIVKRLFDINMAALGLVASSPLWLFIAGLIKKQDGGPIFYTQERVGIGGRRFRSYKFRTMIPDADQRYGPLQAAERDPRVTPVGRWLRDSALDELPQLFNILRGDMSFVGPRALAPREIECGSNGASLALEQIPGYEVRQQVRPGLTGLAQVHARRDLPRRQKFRYDRLYVKRRSFWLDLRLFLLSLGISVRGKWESRQRKI